MRGGKLRLSKPVVEIDRFEKGAQIYLRTRDENEMRKKLVEIAKKIPNLNVEESMKTAEVKYEDVESLDISVTIGGLDALRAVCKCAVNYYIHNGGNKKYIQHLIPYIKCDEEKLVVFRYYQKDVYTIESEESFHVLYLVGNSKERVLYCFVDYFNVCRYLVCLNDCYDGEDIKRVYCYDLMKNEERELKVILDINREEFLILSKSEFDPDNVKKMQELFVRFQVLAHKNQILNKIRKELGGEIDKLFMKHDGKLATDELAMDFTNAFMKVIMPELLRTQRHNQEESKRKEK